MSDPSPFGPDTLHIPFTREGDAAPPPAATMSRMRRPGSLYRRGVQPPPSAEDGADEG